MQTSRTLIQKCKLQKVMEIQEDIDNSWKSPAHQRARKHEFDSLSAEKWNSSRLPLVVRTASSLNNEKKF